MKNEVERMLELVMQEPESINAFDYFLFLKNVRILFHSFYPNVTRDLYCSTFLTSKNLFFSRRQNHTSTSFFLTTWTKIDHA